MNYNFNSFYVLYEVVNADDDDFDPNKDYSDIGPTARAGILGTVAGAGAGHAVGRRNAKKAVLNKAKNKRFKASVNRLDKKNLSLGDYADSVANLTKRYYGKPRGTLISRLLNIRK